MKYIFFSTENSIASIASKLQQEGNQVILGQVKDLNLTLTDEELTHGKQKEDPEQQKRRLSMYDGMVKKADAVSLLKAMKSIRDKGNYFVASDSNSTFRFLEKAQQLGFKGLIHTQEDRSFEVDREKGKEIVQKHYPDVYLSDHKEFKTIEEGIKFLKDSQNVYVLKSLGDSGETVVPKVDDPKIANEIIINTLRQDKKSYETNGFLLEQKILNAIELTPQAVFWDGELVYTSLDIETKTIGAGEKGINVGCGTNLIVKTKPEDPINKIAFPQYVFDEAKKRKGMFIIDAGLLFDVRTNKPYFTEFCTRLGWDAFPTEVAMAGDASGNKIATPYFEKLVQGQNPLRVNFGFGVRLFNLNTDSDHMPESDINIIVQEGAEPDVFLYDAKKEKDRLVSAGYQKDLAVVTGVGNTIQEALQRCTEYVNMVGFKDVLFRSEDDLLSHSYPQSIMRRLAYAVEQKLIDPVDVPQHLESPHDLKVKYEKGISELKQRHQEEMRKVKQALKKAIYGK